MADAIYAIVDNFQNLKFEDIPNRVIDTTKKQILDYFATTFGGVTAAGVKECAELATEWGGAKQSTLFYWGGEKMPAYNAVFANAVMAHALDFDDVHEGAIMHPAVIAVPVALAMAEVKGGLSGKEFLTAIALGTDFICRLGLATRPGESIIPYGWHQTTLYGSITAAAVAARVLGLDAETMLNAIGIAYHTSGGNGQGVKDGTLAKRLGPGLAARSGISAVELAQKGLTGAKNVLEGAWGFYFTYHQNKYSRETLVDDLGVRFETDGVSIKPYPCCRGNHPFIDAALKVTLENDIKPENVAKITLWAAEGTYDLLCKPEEVKKFPRSFVDSQFSVPWCVATAIAHRKATLSEFTEKAIKDPVVLELTGKLNIIVDPSMNSVDNSIDPGRVQVETKDGKVYEAMVRNPVGGADNPLTYEQVAQKLKDCHAFSNAEISEEKVNKLIELIKKMEEMEDVTEIITCLLK